MTDSTVVEPVIANSEEKLYKDRMNRARSIHYAPVSLTRGMNQDNQYTDDRESREDSSMTTNTLDLDTHNTSFGILSIAKCSTETQDTDKLRSKATIRH